MDEEDLMEQILDGVDDEYKELIYVIQAHDTAITFDELHEKLANFEASLHTKQPTLDHLLATANLTHRNINWHSSHSPSHNRGRCPSFLSSNHSPMAPNVGPNLVPSQGDQLHPYIY